MSIPRVPSFTQKLSSKNLIFVMGSNIVLPVLTTLFVNFVIRFQLNQGLMNFVPDQYFKRLTLLFLFLDLVVLGILDYIYIIVPFSHLENVIREYGKLTNMDLHKPFDSHFVKSSLEQNFLDMLTIQKEIDKQARKAESQIQSTELYALQTQINPHFLYNTLDSIRGLALIHHVDEIAAMTEALSNLFRNMIAKEGMMLSLREEFESVKNYMTIQDFRFNNRFVYNCDVPAELMDHYMIPNMTLQPIVENALMHGLEKKFGKGTITISGYATEKRLVLSITDNGVGIDEEKLNYLNERLQNYHIPIQKETTKFHVGIALLNINKRIKLRFGNTYGIYITSTPDISTTTELILPTIFADSSDHRGHLYE